MTQPDRQTTHTILTQTLPSYLSASPSPIYSIIISYYDLYAIHTDTQTHLDILY